MKALTGQTDGADETDIHHALMAETHRPKVDFILRWESDLVAHMRWW